MERKVDGRPMLNVSGAPKYVVEWLEVISLSGEKGDEQVGFVRVGCASLDEVRAELRAEWTNVYLVNFCVLVRNEAGTYEHMLNDEWKDSAMEGFIEKATSAPPKVPQLISVPVAALHPIEDLFGRVQLDGQSNAAGDAETTDQKH